MGVNALPLPPLETFLEHEDFKSVTLKTRLKQWVNHLRTNKPKFVESGSFDDIERRIDTMDHVSIQDVMELKFLMRQLGALDYQTVSIANELNLHSVHLGFRNEWWNLVGMLDGHTPIQFQIWRHTLFPRYLPKQTSVLKFTCAMGTTTVESPWLHEFIATVTANSSFEAKCGGLYHLQSTTSTAIFPMNFVWDGIILENLDNITPMVMLHSNACLSCSDGVGIKMYMYPYVKNDRFNGWFSHAWESGVMPEGFSSNIVQRSLTNLERHFLYPVNSPRVDQWTALFIRFENGMSLWAFFVSIHKQPHRMILIRADGSVERLYQKQPVFVFEKPSFKLTHLKVIVSGTIETFGDDTHFTTTFHRGSVQGVVDGSVTSGWFVMEAPDSRAYHVRANTRGSPVSKTQSPVSKTQYSVAREQYPVPSEQYFAQNDDVGLSVIVWLLPVMFGVFLLLTLVYFILKSSKPSKTTLPFRAQKVK